MKLMTMATVVGIWIIGGWAVAALLLRSRLVRCPHCWCYQRGGEGLNVCEVCEREFLMESVVSRKAKN